MTLRKNWHRGRFDATELPYRQASKPAGARAVGFRVHSTISQTLFTVNNVDSKICWQTALAIRARLASMSLAFFTFFMTPSIAKAIRTAIKFFRYIPYIQRLVSLTVNDVEDSLSGTRFKRRYQKRCQFYITLSTRLTVKKVFEIWYLVRHNVRVL